MTMTTMQSTSTADRTVRRAILPDDDPFLPRPAFVTEIRGETPGIATYRIEFADPDRAAQYEYEPGQFNMLWMPGIGEVPISIASARDEGPGILHTIRATGRVTNAMAKLKPGSPIGMRGPYGRGWPLKQAEGRDVLVVSGGLGLAPLRPVVLALLANRDRYGKVVLMHGARTPKDLLYDYEYESWGKHGIETLITVDRGDVAWRGRVGVVPVLFNRISIDPVRTLMMTCGPEVLMRFAVAEAVAREIPEGWIYYSLERNMHCAIGLCGHCQLGPDFVCKDGPVFDHSQTARFFSREHF